MPSSGPSLLAPRIIAVGASGSAGLTAIRALLADLSPDLDGIVLVVLHRRFDHASSLAAVLQRATQMPVVVADECEHFERGSCYIGEPASHLVLAERSFGGLIADPGAEHRNRTVDLLFRSLAAHAGKRAIGVVLSGSLDDGSRGLAAIHAAGGLTMVITPDNHHAPGMPENAIRYDGPIDFIGTPSQIAQAIRHLIGGGQPA